MCISINGEERKSVLKDADIREGLFDFLEETYGKTRILEEENIGDSRADAVMIVDGALYGIEIKSDADTYTRLARQVPDYDRFFDYNILAVGASHASHAEEHVPAHWGIIVAEPGDDFYMLRTPKKNENRQMSAKLSLLWRPELAHIQELNGMHAYKQLSKANVRIKILEQVSAETLDVQISEELFARDYTTIKETIDDYRRQKGRRARRRRIRRRK